LTHINMYVDQVYGPSGNSHTLNPDVANDDAAAAAAAAILGLA